MLHVYIDYHQVLNHATVCQLNKKENQRVYFFPEKWDYLSLTCITRKSSTIFVAAKLLRILNSFNSWAAKDADS